MKKNYKKIILFLLFILGMTNVVYADNINRIHYYDKNNDSHINMGDSIKIEETTYTIYGFDGKNVYALADNKINSYNASEYKANIANMGISIVDARNLTFDELIFIFKYIHESGYGNEWKYSKTLWTPTFVYNSDYLLDTSGNDKYCIKSKEYRKNKCSNVSGYRPVVVLDKSVIENSYELATEYTLTTTANNGTITEGNKYLSGESVKIEFSANTGYSFKSLSINGVDYTSSVENNSITISMNEDKNVEVVFEAIEYTISATAGSNGTVTLDKETATINDTVTATINPNTGYEIDKVTVNSKEVTVTNNKLELTGITENTSIEVTFKATKYTITATSDTNGTVTVDKETATIEDKVTVTINPNKGYKIGKIIINSEEVIIANKLEITEITEDIEIQVTFEEIIYNVIKGANQEFVINVNDILSFTIDADYSLFNNEVYVDDILVDAKNFESLSGSTIINFTNDFVKNLSLGEHTLRVVFSDGGHAETKFMIDIKELGGTGVSNDNTSINNPNTGDNTMFYVNILLVSVIGLVSGIVYLRKYEI